MATKKADGGGGGAFLTQKGEKVAEVKNEISELEHLLAAAGQTSQSTLLLKKRKEMREVDDSLELMKKDYKRRMDECEERRALFESKQSKMREQVLKFEKFIQENDAKRMRAEIKAKQERKLYEDKIKELNLLNEKILSLEDDQRELSKDLVENSCFKEFLERIVEEGEHGYEEISEILNRHATLSDANKDLVQRSNELERSVDDMRRTLQSLTTEKQNALLVSTSILQAKQNELEKMRSNVKSEEEEKLHREDKKKDVSRELSQVTQAIRNLFGRCFSTMRIKPVFQGQKDSATIQEVLDFELDIIHVRIADLIEICSDYRHLVENAPPPAAPPGGPTGDLRDASVMSVPQPGGLGGGGVSGSKSMVSKS